MLRLPPSWLVFPASAAAPFCDAFAIAATGLMLLDLRPEPGLAGGIAAAYMLGALLGSALFGALSDRLGRRPLMRFASAAALLTLFALSSLSPLELPGDAGLALAGRFLLGFFLGGDYPSAQAFLSEELEGRARERGLSLLMGAWYAGALAAVAAGTLFVPHAGWAGWTLLPAPLIAAALAIRLFMPESKGWSAQRSEHGTSGLRDFTRGDWRKLAFVTGFWLCQIVPSTALFFFGPEILEEAGLAGLPLPPLLALLYLSILIGTLPAPALLPHAGRRALLASTFALMAAGLAAMASPAPVPTLLGFVLFSLSYGLQSVLDYVYPAELFRSAIRGSAIGCITTLTRIGAAAAAWLYPIGAARTGTEAMLLAGSAICAAGLLFSLRFAPRGAPRR